MDRRFSIKEIALFFAQLIKQILQSVLFPALYYFFCIGRKVNDKLVLLADMHSEQRPYSLKLIHDALIDAGFQIQEHYIENKKSTIIQIAKFAAVFMYSYAVARYVFICDYFLPVVSCKKRKETTVVQLWHASGILKKFGYDSAEDIPESFGIFAAKDAAKTRLRRALVRRVLYRGNLFKNYSLVTVSSPECVTYYESAMRLHKGICVPIGIARTDCLFNQYYVHSCKEKLLCKYPQLANKKIALWVPTFRGNVKQAYTAGVEDIIKLNLQEDWCLVVKQHPHAPRAAGLFQPEMDASEIFPAADVLITDYSTILFEFSLLGKPIILFLPDGDQYEQRRGIYIPLNEIPAPVVYTREELAGAIENAQSNYSPERWESFRQKYMSSCDGNTVQRILERVCAVNPGVKPPQSSFLIEEAAASKVFYG
ncbi:MAG: CDP-glycerol glycerophosphotransferase family protein [Syntrophomonadaceae bacterium]|nr:CDP-glycerol glycerophosphotransferase family protein [Syntrophomonadaceae bacterium]